MPKFTFICDHNDNLGKGPVIKYETEHIHIDDVLFDFTDFLRGCGFVFSGNVDIVEEHVDEVNFDREAEESRVRWSHTVNSLMNPPTFRANEPVNPNCSVCGLPESVMKAHQCWDQKCPIHSQSIYADGCESPSAGA